MESETLSLLLGMIFSVAEDIYFRKCMFYNVPRLSDSDKKKCLDEAIEFLQKLFEYHKKASEVIEGKGGPMTDEQRAKRVHYHIYETCEGIKEHAERIVKLEELVADAHACKENDGCCEDCYADEGDCPIEQRMRELGIEVD